MLHRTFAALAAAIFLSLSSGALAAGPPKGMPALPPQPKVHPAGIPANYMMVSPCIVGMGEHWANLKAGIHGTTLYGTYQGKPVFTEIMLLPADFASGKSYENVLRPVPGYQIDHVDIEYLKHGHPGMAFAHYDIHAYYVTPAVEHKICPGGVPVPM
ncbi:MAG: hypothetical protein ABR584_11605 [Candidatus Baltobacteraceae bacterium]